MYKEGWNKQKVMEQVKKFNNNSRAYDGGCQYEAGDGNRCAIGCFIPEYHEALYHGGGSRSLFANYPKLRDYMPFDNDNDLSAFQSAHDTFGACYHTAEIKGLDLYQTIELAIDTLEKEWHD